MHTQKLSFQNRTLLQSKINRCHYDRSEKKIKSINELHGTLTKERVGIFVEHVRDMSGKIGTNVVMRRMSEFQ